MPLGQVSISYYLPHLQCYHYRADIVNVEPCQLIGEIYMQHQMFVMGIGQTIFAISMKYSMIT